MASKGGRALVGADKHARPSEDGRLAPKAGHHLREAAQSKREDRLRTVRILTRIPSRLGAGSRAVSADPSSLPLMQSRLGRAHRRRRLTGEPFASQSGEDGNRPSRRPPTRYSSFQRRETPAHDGLVVTKPAQSRYRHRTGRAPDQGWNNYTPPPIRIRSEYRSSQGDV